MDLTVVGCTGSMPGPDSPASAYLLTAPHDGRDWRLLLDLGSGAFGALQRHADPLSIDAVVLSHLHPDHCLDLTALQVWRAHGPARASTDLPVHAPAGAAERMARAYGVRAAEPVRGMVFHDLDAGRPFSVGPFTITPYPVLHPVPSFGLRVEAAGAVLAYTGDTDSCPGLVPLMTGAHLVLADAAFIEGRDEARGVHLTARRAAEAAREAGGVGRLVLTHLPPWNDPDVVLGEARAVWSGPTEVVRPGATYPVGTGEPGAGQNPGGRSTLHHAESVTVSAAPEELYDLVSDVTRTGEWSPVCKACWWDEGHSAREGAWFTGRNELPERTWETRSQVVAADRGREFAFVVGGSYVRWGFTFTPVDGGTQLSESWQFLPEGIAMFHQRYGADADRQIRLRTQAALDGIPATLAAIRSIAEAGDGQRPARQDPGEGVPRAPAGPEDSPVDLDGPVNPA